MNKYDLERKLEQAARNMKQARIVAEQIKIASEPEPQTTGNPGANLGPSGAPSFTQVKR